MTEDLRHQLNAAVGAPGAPPVEQIVARGEQFARRQLIRRASIATALVLVVVGAGVGGFASARRGPDGRVQVRGETPVSPMTEPAAIIPLTPDRVAGELKTLQGTDPILLPAAIPADWTPQVSTSATNFSVTYTAPDGIESVSLSIAIPNPPEPLANTTQRTLTFRRDPKAFYQAQDGTAATADRFLIWNEPGVWAADDPSTPQPHPSRSVPYYLSSQGLTDSQFWAIANSLRPITTVTPPTTAPAPATTIGSTVPATAIALSAVRWDQVTYPLQCGTTLQGPTPTQVLAVVYPQVNPGTQVAAVLVACHAGAGTPPRVLYVFDRASSPTTPHLLQTLSDDNRSTTPTRVTNTISASGPDITSSGSLYSSPNIPRCCPDGTFTARWTWTGSGYRQAP